jgi:hypothetical protein
MTAARFRHFAAIDWSGAKGPRQKGIAVAICGPGSDVPTLERPGYRWSRADILDWLLHNLPEDTLVGLDLAPGLPFDAKGGYFPGWPESPGTAKELWRKVDELSQEDDHLTATSFLTHHQVRRHFRHGKDARGDMFVSGAGRMRQTEIRQRKHQLTPSSCFNLVGPAQVGKSSLTGMRVLHSLGGAIPVWPFDPVPASGSVIVEIYTSLAARTAEIRPGRAKMRSWEELDEVLIHPNIASRPTGNRGKVDDHTTDAILTAAWLRRAADEPALWQPEGLAEVAQTEGWTFGVV